MRSSDSLITTKDDSIFSNWSLWIAVASQIATISITWPLWQIRSDPPLLPAFSLALPQLNFGWIMIVSCLLILIRPWLGVWLHLATMLAACIFDEMRTQPQFFAIWVLLLASAKSQLEPVARWFLISMWIWAGVHKLLSPDWFSHTSSDLITRISLELTVWHWPFVVGIAIAEIFTGLAAIAMPRKAAYLCVLMHIGIVGFLSPVALNWNYSVIPWNLATAILGYNILRKSEKSLPNNTWEWVVAAVLFIYPAGFYVGWVDHGIAFVLYSGHTPKGLITTKDELIYIRGWKSINVPFPNERRLLKRHFEVIAKPGDKLHIQDPRAWLDDQFFVLLGEGESKEIGEQKFRSVQPIQSGHAAIKGVLLDDYVALWHLGRAGAKMLKRTEGGMVYAIQIPPESYAAELIELVNRIPNLEQLQLMGTGITDETLLHLKGNPSLEGIGLSATKITNASLPVLESIPNLKYIEIDGSDIDADLINDLLLERQTLAPN